MVEIFRNCDEEYGRRVEEGLRAAGTEVDTKMEDAVNLAEELGHPSDLY